MSNNLSQGGTAHIRAILNAALQSETGIQIKGLEKGKAVYIRGILHSVRNAERKKSMSMWEPGDPKYGTSGYDILVTELLPEADGFVSLRIVRSDKVTSELVVIDEASGEALDLNKYL